MTVVLRQDALKLVSADLALAAEVDRRWATDPRNLDVGTVGEQMRGLDDLCREVLIEHGYQVKGRA